MYEWTDEKKNIMGKKEREKDGWMPIEQSMMHDERKSMEKKTNRNREMYGWMNAFKDEKKIWMTERKKERWMNGRMTKGRQNGKKNMGWINVFMDENNKKDG